MTKHQTEIEGVLDAVETSYFVTQILAGCNGKTAINAYNAAVDEFNSAVNRYYAIDAAKNDNGKKALHQAKISAEVTARIIIDYAADLKGVQRGIIRGEFICTPQRHAVDIDEAVAMQRENHGSIIDDTLAFELRSINDIVKPIVDKASAPAEFEPVLQEPPKPIKRKEKSDDEQLSIDFDAWRQCSLDFDLQAASVNTAEKTELIGRFINAVNSVKASKQAANETANVVINNNKERLYGKVTIFFAIEGEDIRDDYYYVDQCADQFFNLATERFVRILKHDFKADRAAHYVAGELIDENRDLDLYERMIIDECFE